MRYVVKSRHIRIEDVTIVGRSIGTGVAAQLAAENSHVRGLVLLSPYTNVADVARETWLYRILPLSLIGKRNQFDTLSKIGSIHVPVLVIVGSADDLTPPWMAKALMDRARSPKRLVIIPNADHINLFTKRRTELVSTLAQFTAPIANR